MLTVIIKYFCITVFGLMLFSCGNDIVNTNSENDLIFEQQGLVDSAVVTGCYDYTRFHFLNDTFSTAGYRKLRVEFDGLTSSDRAKIFFVQYSSGINNNIVYQKNNEEVNMQHNFEIDAPAETSWYELRLFLSPQVCGENEFKFIRARDLKVYGIK